MTSINKESTNIIISLIILSLVIYFPFILSQKYQNILQSLIFAFLIISITVIAKKMMASLLDSDVEHSIWGISRYWVGPGNNFQKEIPAGILVPIITSIITLGYLPFLALLTFETRILKRRASRRFGIYSYTEMTDWHNALIGASGIISVIILSAIGYLLGYETLARISSLYAFANIFPISNLDGAQIFFGSRVLWTTLTVITVIFIGYALILI